MGLSRPVTRGNCAPPGAPLPRLPRPPMPSAELNGLQIHYDVHGEGDPLLCVHRPACDRRAWAIPRQGHGVMWEAAEQSNTAVTEFLAATPAEAVR